MSCGGGSTERFKNIIDFPGTFNTCAGVDSKERYGRKECNKDKCEDNGKCIAEQDIFVFVDPSIVNEDSNSAVLEIVKLLFGEDGTYINPGTQIWVDGEDKVVSSISVDALKKTFSTYDPGSTDPGSTFAGPYKQGRLCPYDRIIKALTNANTFFSGSESRKDKSSIIFLIFKDIVPNNPELEAKLVELKKKARIVAITYEGHNNDFVDKMVSTAPGLDFENRLFIPSGPTIIAKATSYASLAMHKFCPNIGAED